jgi:hypothetical protein
MFQNALNGFIRKSLKEIMSKSPEEQDKRRSQNSPSSPPILHASENRGKEKNKKE